MIKTFHSSEYDAAYEPVFCDVECEVMFLFETYYSKHLFCDISVQKPWFVECLWNGT